jgi:hypothetical protein
MKMLIRPVLIIVASELGMAGIDHPLSADGPHLRMVRKCMNLHPMAMLPATPPMVKLLIDARASVTAVDAS